MSTRSASVLRALAADRGARGDRAARVPRSSPVRCQHGERWNLHLHDLGGTAHPGLSTHGARLQISRFCALVCTRSAAKRLTPRGTATLGGGWRRHAVRNTRIAKCCPSLYGECMARLISTTIRLHEEDVRALKRARAAGHSASELVRKGLRVVASRYYKGRRPPSTRLFESTDTKLGDESELFRDIEG